MTYCEGKHWRCTLQEAHLTASRIWNVHLQVFTPFDHGHLHLDYDARDGRLLHTDSRLTQTYGVPQSPEHDPYGERIHGDD